MDYKVKHFLALFSVRVYIWTDHQNMCQKYIWISECITSRSAQHEDCEAPGYLRSVLLRLRWS